MAVITVTTEPVIEPQTHTPSFYDQIVGEVLPVLDRILQVVPKVEESDGITAKEVRSNLFVTDAFCADAIDAVEQTPELAAMNRVDPVQSRKDLQFLLAIRPLEHKLKSVTKRVTHTIRAVKSRLGGNTLTIYRVAQELSVDGRSPGIKAHVEAMKLSLGRRASTKAVRDQRKAERFEAAVQAEVAKRLALMKEVKAA